MFNFLSTLTQDIHPIVVHFPIVLFTLSFAFVLVSRIWPSGLGQSGLGQMEWLLLVLGVIAAPIAVISGIVAHFPYEESSVAAFIEPHQFLAFLGTLIMIAFVVWRAASRRRGNDIGEKGWYVIFAILGLVWIFVVGGTGGQLVYQYAINVRGSNPLFP